MAVSGRKGMEDLGIGSQDYFEINCDPCHEVEGSFLKPEGFCPTCNEYMCTSCLKVHGLRRKTRNHDVLRGDDMPVSKPPEPTAATLSCKTEEECTDVCEKHRGQIIRYFCKYHNCLGCMDCIAFEHNCGSNVVLIADISSEGATEIDFQRFSEKLDQLSIKFTDSVKDAEEHVKDAETQFKKANDDASQFSEEMINKIRSLKTEVEGRAREIKDKDCNKMQRLINQSNSLFHETKQMATDFESLRKCRRRTQQFTFMKKMHVRLEELEQNSIRMDEDNFISSYRFCPEKRIKETIKVAKRLGKIDLVSKAIENHEACQVPRHSEVERLMDEVKELEFPHDDQIVTVQIGRAEEKDVPMEWCISPDQKPPEISGSPKDTQKKMPSSFGVSGFYENYRPPENNPELRHPDGAGGQQNYVQPNPGQPCQGQGHDPTRGPYPQQTTGPYGGFPPHPGPFTGEDKGQGNMGQYPIITLVNPHTGEKAPGIFDPQIGQNRPLSYPGMPPFAHQQYPQGQGYPMPPQPTGPPPPYNSGGRGHMGHAPHENLRHDVVKGNEDTTKPSKAVADQEEFLEKLNQKKAKEEQHQGAQLALQCGQLKMQGHPIYLEMMSEPLHEDIKPPLSTVQVKTEVSIDLVEMYFESKKRSGGGEIEEVKCVGNGVYLVTFMKEEVATRVVGRDGHEINGQPVEVELYNPHEEEEEEKEEDEQGSTTSTPEPVRVVAVRGVQNVGDRGVLEMYFESKKRSGGGEIEKIEDDEDDIDLVYITFEDAEVAKTVTERSHIINGQEVETWLYDPRQDEAGEDEDVGPLFTVVPFGCNNSLI